MDVMRINIAFILFFLLAGCREKGNQTLFTKLSPKETGIFFNNQNLEDENYNVLVYEYFYNGGGVAAGDINNDGLTDLYFSANQKSNRLYLNKGNFVFEDITDRSGVSAKDGWKTGVAMVDINADGLLDIYVCRSAANDPAQRRNSLFINKGDLTFEDRAHDYGLDDDSYSTQASFLDFDCDGDLDMFLLNHSVSRVVRNYDIRTENKTERVPYVGNKLYENRNGKFTDISEHTGIFGPAHNYGLGVAYSDLNMDGWPDIYASNDYTGSDNLLINVQGKYFRNDVDTLLTHISRFSMGTDIADVNNDGLPDIITLDMLPDNNHRQKELLWPDQYDIYSEMVRNGLHHQYMRNMLHLNNGNGSFTEIGQLAGLSNTDWSWSALFADYDNDGLQDVFISNGYKRDYTNNDFLKYRADKMMAQEVGRKPENYAKLFEKMPSNKISNYIFHNINGLQFSDSTLQWGLHDFTLTHGAVYADLDNDGDQDLIVNNMDDPAGIYRNNSDQLKKNRFLKVKLVGSGQNKFGLGAKVIVYAADKIMMRELCPYRGFQSSVEPILNFGLGQISAADSVIVQWPGGGFQKLVDVISNQTITIQQSGASPAGIEVEEVSHTLFISDARSINFNHHESNFIDFKTQPLMQRMYSADGPALAKGDINKDGLMDLYIGGAKDQAAALYLQNKSGAFTKKSISVFDGDAASEDVDAVFFDIDGDQDQDLYVVTGSYEFNEGDPLLADKLYRNDHGNFVRVQLPQFLSSGSCVRPLDIDMDGDIDLFVGGRVRSGRYPETPESYILLNDGHGKFSVATDLIAPELKQAGMVTDAAWLDVNNDQVKDLIVVGEWMGVMIFENHQGKLSDQSKHYFSEDTRGFWNCILAYDFDNDGDDDLLVGNHGLNSQIKPSQKKPATLYYGDFDNNGSIDPLLCYYVKDTSYPFPTRDELTEHLPYQKKHFRDYRSYADATIDSILTPDQLSKANRLHATRLETTYFENKNGSFSIKQLPLQFQFAPVFALAVADVNGDGHPDVISGGNNAHTRARTGMLKGNQGFVFAGDGKGNFSFLPTTDTGINFPEDVRHIVVDNKKVFFGINNGPVKVFSLNLVP
jgi:hypothetical protein